MDSDKYQALLHSGMPTKEVDKNCELDHGNRDVIEISNFTRFFIKTLFFSASYNVISLYFLKGRIKSSARDGPVRTKDIADRTETVTKDRKDR